MPQYADIKAGRAALEGWVPPVMPCGMRAESFEVDGLRGEWLKPAGPFGRCPAAAEPKGAVLLYLHGGGYCMCSPRTHRSLTTTLGHMTGLPVCILSYRLAPEHPFPCPVEDAQAAYRWLLERGYRADQIVLAGDSAGGGLVLATLIAARDQGLPMPAAAALFSPWTDLACTGHSLVENEPTCVMFTAATVREGAALYLAGQDPTHPLASPLYADLRGLPPLLIHASDSEVLLDDATRLAERAIAAGVEVVLKVWTGQPHVWQLFPHIMPEARESLCEASKFLLDHLPGQKASRFDQLMLGE
jgi:monoterpene epsilon-lactone hydrolase